jgi:phage host-nuclease inhibitor protein Gam
MSKKGTKAPKDVHPVASWEEANTALSEIGQRQAKINAIQAAYDEDEQKRKDALNKALEPLKSEIDKYHNGLFVFAMQHRPDFGEKKSRELMNGILAFRQNPPSVKQASKVKVDVTLQLLSESDDADRFIRIKDEINKDAILDAYASGELTVETLKKYGLKIEQDEEFTVKIKMSSVTKTAERKAAA